MPKKPMTLKTLERRTKEFLPKGVTFARPKGLPRGSEWAIKPNPKKEYVFDYDESDPNPDGSYSYTVTMPFELSYTVTETYE